MAPRHGPGHCPRSNRALWREGTEVVELQLAAPTLAETAAAETEALLARSREMARAWAACGGRRVTALDRAVPGPTPATPERAPVAEAPRARRPGSLKLNTAVYTPMAVPDLSELPADDLSWLPAGVERIAFGHDDRGDAVDVADLRRHAAEER